MNNGNPSKKGTLTALAVATALAGIALQPAAARARSQSRPWVGIMMGSDQRPGVPILETFKGSPARKAGLKKGDRLVAVDGKTVSTASQVIRIVARHKIGATLNVRYQRMGAPGSTAVTLAARPSMEKLMQSLLVGKEAPDFTVSLPQKVPNLRLSHLRGKVVLLKFWSLSCPACLRSISTLRKWHKKLASKGLVILGVAKEPLARLKRAASKYRINYLVGRNPQKASELYHTPLIPMFVLVDQKGKVRDVALGYGKSMNRLRRKIKALLKAGTKSSSARKGASPARSADDAPPTPTSPPLVVPR